MPDGTVSQETYRRDLKSLPPDGFVELKMLPYYDMLVRRDKGSIASMEQSEKRRKRGEEVSAKMTIETLQTWEREYMFQNCITDHNITDKNGVKLDFKNPMTFRMLRPDIGLEIEQLIDELHEASEVDGNFPNAHTSSTEPQEPEQLNPNLMDIPTN